MKKIIPYLLLNIAVSAVTMLAVILIWNASHPNSSAKVDASDFSLLETPENTAVSLPPLADKTVEIQSVFMPGDIEYEKMTVKCVSSSAVDLTGWSLNDSQGNHFEFPSLTIFPGGAVDIYSHAGMNTAVELFWNSSTAIWSAGEKVNLKDSAGNLRTTYTIP